MKKIPESVLAARLGAGSESKAPAEPAPAMSGGASLVDFSQAITPQEGVEVFRRLLALRNLPQVAVSTRALDACLERARTLT